MPQKLAAQNIKTNVSPELNFMAPLFQRKNRAIQIVISEITLQRSFVEKHNNKCFLRVKLTQLPDQLQMKNAPFYVYSRFFPLAVKLPQSGEDVKIPISEAFLVNKLLDSADERFSLSVHYTSGYQPLPKVMLDYIQCSELDSF